MTIVGSELAVSHAEKVLGNSLKRLNHPNLIPIFLGIALGCILGSLPFMFPGIPQPVKLGLAGGPLVVSILIRRFGPQYKLITYTTMSANLMIREIGIALFLACVGLGAEGIHRYHYLRRRLCVDWLWGHHHGRSVAGDRIHGALFLEAELLYADRCAVRG